MPAHNDAAELIAIELIAIELIAIVLADAAREGARLTLAQITFVVSASTHSQRVRSIVAQWRS